MLEFKLEMFAKGIASESETDAIVRMLHEIAMAIKSGQCVDHNVRVGSHVAYSWHCGTVVDEKQKESAREAFLIDFLKTHRK